MRYSVLRISNSVSTYRHCDTYNEAVSALDRLEHTFRFSGTERLSLDHLRVGLTTWTVANEFRIVATN